MIPRFKRNKRANERILKNWKQNKETKQKIMTKNQQDQTKKHCINLRKSDISKRSKNGDGGSKIKWSTEENCQEASFASCHFKKGRCKIREFFWCRVVSGKIILKRVQISNNTSS